MSRRFSYFGSFLDGFSSLYHYAFGSTKHILLGTDLNSLISGSGATFTYITNISRGNIGNNEWFLSNWTSQLLFRFSPTTNIISILFKVPAGTFSWSGGTAYTDTDDHLIAIVWDENETGNDKLKIYYDGVDVSAGGNYSGTAGAITSSAGGLRIGINTANSLRGRYNYSAFLDVAASSSEISDYYNGGTIQTFESIWGANVYFEHLVDNDTWDGSNYDVVDEQGNVTGKETVNMLIGDKVSS